MHIRNIGNLLGLIFTSFANVAKEAGILMAISSDAHNLSTRLLRLDINQARRAGLTANDVINIRNLKS